MWLENRHIGRTGNGIETSCDLFQLMFSSHFVIFLEVQLDIFLFVLLGHGNLWTVGLQVELFDLETLGVVFHHAKCQSQVGWVIFLYELQWVENIFVQLLNVFHCDFVICDSNAHFNIHIATIGHRLSEGNTKNFSDEKVLLSNSNSFPSHHKLSYHTSMIATLFFVKLNKEPFTIDLIESHIKRTLSGNKDILSINTLVNLRHFEHERRIDAYLSIFREVRYQQLLELASTERLDFQ